MHNTAFISIDLSGIFRFIIFNFQQFWGPRYDGFNPCYFRNGDACDHPFESCFKGPSLWVSPFLHNLTIVSLCRFITFDKKGFHFNGFYTTCLQLISSIECELGIFHTQWSTTQRYALNISLFHVYTCHPQDMASSDQFELLNPDRVLLNKYNVNTLCPSMRRTRNQV